MSRIFLLCTLPFLFICGCNDALSPVTEKEPVSNNTPAQEEPAPVHNPDGPMIQGEWLNVDKLKERIDSALPVKKEDLLGKWNAITWISYVEVENEEPVFLDLSYDGLGYTFHNDGMYQVEAILPTDGDWELRDSNILYLHNHFRDDEELHSVILEGDTMELTIEFDGTYSYMVLVKAGQ